MSCRPQELEERREEMMRSILFILLCGFYMPGLLAQGFVNQTGIQGIDVLNQGSTFGNGVSFYDFNQDGWDDLSFCTNITDPVFYINNQGIYEEIDLGIENVFGGDIKVLQWVDYDNDGDSDLFMSTSYYPVTLFENIGNLELVDVTEDAGIAIQFVRNFGSCWGDVNNDGWLDLYICKYHNPNVDNGYEYTNHLYMNNGDGTFTDETDNAEVSDEVRASFQSVFMDYDEDGYQDIFVINDRLFMRNSMYWNEGDGSFQDKTTEVGMELYIDAMSITVGDYDNDTDLDIYIANDPYESTGNVLMNYFNDGFTDFGQFAGVTTDWISWGSLWIDYDCDMDQDLYVTTEGNTIPITIQNYFHESQGDGTFELVHDEIGLEDDDYASFGAAMGDYDNDGYPDFVINNYTTNSQLYKNTGGENNWFKISLEGTISNKDGIGSWIYVYTGDVVQTRYTMCGENYLGQDSQREMFGLGQEEMIDSLEIKWLSGHVDLFYDVPVDTTWHVLEGSSIPHEITESTDLILCEADSAFLSAGDFESFLWSTGDETQDLAIYEPGEYWVIGYNAMGIPVQSNTVLVQNSPLLESEAVVENVVCYGGANGAISILSPPIESILSYSWDSGDLDLSIDSLTAGTYTLTMEDEYGCAVQIDFDISQPAVLQASFDVMDVSCFGLEDGQVSEQITGGTPGYQINWNGADTTALSAGTYPVSIVDSLGCVVDTSFVVDQPDLLEIELTTGGVNDTENGTAVLDITGGTEPYSIEWSSGEMDIFEVEDLGAGDFSVLVIDSNGCEIGADFTITSVPLFDSENPVFVFPNPCTDYLTIESLPELCTISNYTLFDATGRKMEVNWINSQTIDMRTVAAGQFLLRIVCDDKVTNLKFTKSN